MLKIDPKTLAVHPAAAAIPDLSPAQYAALKDSIARQGIHTRLLIDTENRVIDGRHRLKAAMELGLEIVPCDTIADEVTADDTRAAVIACEAAVARRNLTTSGRVLVLFLAHPDLAKGAKERGHGNLMPGAAAHKKAFGPILYGPVLPTTYRSVAERYGVPEDYFTTLAEIERKCAGDPEAWAAAQRMILDDEISIPRVNAGIGSRLSTTGKKRGEPSYDVLAGSAAVTLGNAFARWGSFSPLRTSEALGALRTAWQRMPDVVRALTRETIVECWPAHEQAELAAMLKQSGKRSGAF